MSYFVFFCWLFICKGVLTPTLQPVCNWFATRKKLKSQSGCKGRGKVFFNSPTSRRLKSVASCLLNMHKRLAATEFDREWLYRSPNDCQIVADWSAIDRRPVAD